MEHKTKTAIRILRKKVVGKRGSDVDGKEKNWCNGYQNTLIHFILYVKK